MTSNKEQFQETTMSAYEFVNDGLTETATQTIESKYNYAESLKVRRDIELAGTKRAREKTNADTWMFGEGEYSKEKIKQMENVIQPKLEKATSENPIVVIDFGAGLGLTMIDIANRYAKDIATGKLIIIATNLVGERERLPNFLDEKQIPSHYTGIAKTIYGRSKQIKDSGTPNWMEKKHLLNWLKLRKISI